MSTAESGSYFRRTQDILLSIENGVLVTLLVMIIATAVVQIVLRNFFNTGIFWGDVLVRILVLWIGMLGAMVASRRGDHISIDVVTRHLSPRAKQRVNGLVQITTFLICTLVAYHSLRFVLSEVEYGGNAFAGVPVWLCEAIIPFGFAVIALRYLLLATHSFLQLSDSAS